MQLRRTHGGFFIIPNAWNAWMHLGRVRVPTSSLVCQRSLRFSRFAVGSTPFCWLQIGRDWGVEGRDACSSDGWWGAPSWQLLDGA